MKTARSIFLVFSLLTLPLFAQDVPMSDVVQKGQRWAGWSFQEENDVLTETNTDKYYTQGLRLSLTRSPFENPKVIDRFAEKFVERFNSQLDAAPAIWTIGLGQNIYTPDDVTIVAPQLNDRHWGGFLYFDNIVQIVAKDESVRHLFELQTGIVGPGSGARYAQTKVHELIDSAAPLGWSNQLRNEPGVNLIYSYDRRYPRELGPLDFDFLPHAGGSLGTVMTYANAGAIVRLGKNNTGFPNVAARASAYTQFSGNRPNWEFWVYGGVDGRAVAHNIFLSGGLLKSVPSELETERFVYDLMSGLSVRYRRWRLTYNIVRRSKEFDHPFATGDGKTAYGSVMLSVEPVLPRDLM